MKNQYYGWFSAQALEYSYSLSDDARPGAMVWARPDGSPVVVTTVAQDESPDYPGYQWPDKVFVGPVTHYVRAYDGDPWPEEWK
jgi:hypothetical protein